jgi:polyphenol oxidase
MIEHEQAGIVYFEFESFGGNGRIQHAIFSRQGGVSLPPHDSLNLSVSVPDEKTAVYTNRAKAFGLFGRQNHTVVHAHLIHGSDVARVTQANNGTWVERVDALITNEPGCALTMNFADCTPILLYDPVRHAIGLGHAGWKGAVVDLPGAMVRAMQREFGSQPADLRAGIGPCISWANYEVAEPLVSEVKAAFPEWQTLLMKQDDGGNGRYHFDLPEANRRNLVRAGVQQIELPGLCTADRTDLFFSHRAEKGKTGRFGSIFVLCQMPTPD